MLRNDLPLCPGSITITGRRAAGRSASGGVAVGVGPAEERGVAGELPVAGDPVEVASGGRDGAPAGAGPGSPTAPQAVINIVTTSSAAAGTVRGP